MNSKTIPLSKKKGVCPDDMDAVSRAILGIISRSLKAVRGRDASGNGKDFREPDTRIYLACSLVLFYFLETTLIRKCSPEAVSVFMKGLFGRYGQFLFDALYPGIESAGTAPEYIMTYFKTNYTHAKEKWDSQLPSGADDTPASWLCDTLGEDLDGTQLYRRLRDEWDAATHCDGKGPSGLLHSGTLHRLCLHC